MRIIVVVVVAVTVKAQRGPRARGGRREGSELSRLRTGSLLLSSSMVVVVMLVTELREAAKTNHLFHAPLERGRARRGRSRGEGRDGGRGCWSIIGLQKTTQFITWV